MPTATVYAGCEVEELEHEQDANHYYLRFEDEEGERISLWDLPDLLADRLTLEVIHGGSHPGSPEGGIDLPTMSQELGHLDEALVGEVTWSEQEMAQNPESYTFHPVESIEIEEEGALAEEEEQ